MTPINNEWFYITQWKTNKKNRQKKLKIETKEGNKNEQ